MRVNANELIAQLIAKIEQLTRENERLKYQLEKQSKE